MKKYLCGVRHLLQFIPCSASTRLRRMSAISPLDLDPYRYAYPLDGESRGTRTPFSAQSCLKTQYNIHVEVSA